MEETVKEWKDLYIASKSVTEKVIKEIKIFRDDIQRVKEENMCWKISLWKACTLQGSNMTAVNVTNYLTPEMLCILTNPNIIKIWEQDKNSSSKASHFLFIFFMWSCQKREIDGDLTLYLTCLTTWHWHWKYMYIWHCIKPWRNVCSISHAVLFGGIRSLIRMLFAILYTTDMANMNTFTWQQFGPDKLCVKKKS